jgi:hypothetical protein
MLADFPDYVQEALAAAAILVAAGFPAELVQLGLSGEDDPRIAVGLRASEDCPCFGVARPPEGADKASVEAELLAGVVAWNKASGEERLALVDSSEIQREAVLLIAAMAQVAPEIRLGFTAPPVEE